MACFLLLSVAALREIALKKSNSSGSFKNILRRESKTSLSDSMEQLAKEQKVFQYEIVQTSQLHEYQMLHIPFCLNTSKRCDLCH